jgi:hypothetical protein
VPVDTAAFLKSGDFCGIFWGKYLYFVSYVVDYSGFTYECRVIALQTLQRGTLKRLLMNDLRRLAG